MALFACLLLTFLTVVGTESVVPVLEYSSINYLLEHSSIESTLLSGEVDNEYVAAPTTAPSTAHGSEAPTSAAAPVPRAATDSRRVVARDFRQDFALQAKYGGALWFDGIDDYMTVPRDDGLEPPSEELLDLSFDSFTFEAWVRHARRARTAPTRCLFSQGRAEPDEGLQIGFTANLTARLSFWGEPAGGCEFAASPHEDDIDHWHHWAFSFDADTMAARVYRDGVQELHCAKQRLYKGVGRLFVARGIESRTEPVDGAAFRGALDEIRVWVGVALNRYKITAYMGQTGAGITEYHPYRRQLAGYWRLDDEALSEVAQALKSHHLETQWRGAGEVGRAVGARPDLSFRPHLAMDSSGRGVYAQLWNGPRWVQGVPRSRVPVEDVARSLAMDEGLMNARQHHAHHAPARWALHAPHPVTLATYVTPQWSIQDEFYGLGIVIDL